jgi:hypothetical protein
MRPHPGIQIHKIPAEGVGGLIFAVGTAMIVLIGIPAVRPLVALAVLGGIVLAPLLHKYRY